MVQCPAYRLDLLISKILFLDLNMSMIRFVNMVLMFLILNYQLSDLHAFIIGLELDFDIVTTALCERCSYVLVDLFSFFLIALTITASLPGEDLIIQNEDIMMGSR